MEVRPATRTQLAAVGTVIQAAFFDTFQAMLRPETIANQVAVRYGPAPLKRAMMRGGLFVAVDDSSTVVGAAVTEHRDDHLFVDILAIHPEHRKQGVGRMLLERLQEIAPALPMSIILLLGGEQGEPFLEAQGFVPGEVIEQDLGGEPTVGRRWWRIAEEPHPG